MLGPKCIRFHYFKAILFHRLVQYWFLHTVQPENSISSETFSPKMPLGLQNTQPLSTLHYYRQAHKATKHSGDNVCEFIRTTNSKTPCPLAGVFPCHASCSYIHNTHHIYIYAVSASLLLSYCMYSTVLDIFILTVQIYIYIYIPHEA